MRQIPLVALTGGTVAGKSTVSGLLARELGDCAVFVPETGTAVLADPEFRPPRSRKGPFWEQWQFVLQRRIFERQRQAEEAALRSAEAQGRRLVVTDRGTPDCWIWLSGKAGASFEESLGTTLTLELARYAAVIYLPSLAIVSKPLYLRHRRSNPFRLPRSVKSAREVEVRTRAVWREHPSIYWMIGSHPVEEKACEAAAVCRHIVHSQESSDGG